MALAMLRDDATLNPYGFPESQWEAAKAEAKSLLADCAKRGQPIAYSDFVKKLHSIHLEHRDPRLFQFLGEISAEEDAAGRGMLTALVIHKSGDMKPGPGFFELAKTLGHATSDTDKLWIEQINKVFSVWRK
jgi:hypothetical protein